MAMDALQNLVNNIPDWLRHLEGLGGQIDKRQAELAAVAAAERKSPGTKSLRNKGSTESLKPKDDPPMHAEDPTNEDIRKDANAESAAQGPVETPDASMVYTPSPGYTQQQQTVIEVVQAGERARVGKKPKSAFMTSDEEAPTGYRERSRIIVYYDAYVQGFFSELVRFVSSCGNLIRKAKMAAGVAQIKKLAQEDVSEDGNNDYVLLSLQYMSSRRFGLITVYYTLGKDLEFVQSMCERAAEKSLRKGVCTYETRKVRKRLKKVFKMAKIEMKRVQREEPESAKETGEMGGPRIRQPVRMRREMPVGLKEGSPTPTKDENKLEPAKLEAAEPTPAPDSMWIQTP